MTNERTKELLAAAVNHIQNFEDDMSDEVLASLGFTKDELAEIDAMTRSNDESAKYVDGYISYNGKIIWLLSNEGSKYIYSDQREDEEENWVTHCVPFKEISFYIDIKENGFCTGYVWYNSKENYVEDFLNIKDCLDWLIGVMNYGAIRK